MPWNPNKQIANNGNIIYKSQRNRINKTIGVSIQKCRHKHNNFSSLFSHIFNTILVRKSVDFPYIYIIIIIMSCRQHGYLWPSLATSPYHSSLLAGLQGYIPYLHIATVCMFELVILLLLSHMRGSIGVHHWWVRTYFSSCVLRVWFV